MCEKNELNKDDLENVNGGNNPKETETRAANEVTRTPFETTIDGFYGPSEIKNIN